MLRVRHGSCWRNTVVGLLHNVDQSYNPLNPDDQAVVYQLTISIMDTNVGSDGDAIR